MKDITDLSKKQKNSRLETMNTRAQKELWFINLFGLEFERFNYTTTKEQNFHWDIPIAKESTKY